MAAVSLFWDTNMAAVTSCENILYNKTPASCSEAIVHLCGEEGAEMFKKSALDLNSVFYP